MSCTGRRNPLTGRYLVPSERTFRRVLAAVDGDALDTATCGYAADVVRVAPRPRRSPPPRTVRAARGQVVAEPSTGFRDAAVGELRWARGRRSMNRLPCGTTSSYQTWPWFASASNLDRYSPKPA
ncbi:hypothetical protein AB0B58_42115, partial [Actinoplanes sp. NPDC049118]